MTDSMIDFWFKDPSSSSQVMEPCQNSKVVMGWNGICPSDKTSLVFVNIFFQYSLSTYGVKKLHSSQRQFPRLYNTSRMFSVFLASDEFQRLGYLDTREILLRRLDIIQNILGPVSKSKGGYFEIHWIECYYCSTYVDIMDY